MVQTLRFRASSGAHTWGRSGPGKGELGRDRAVKEGGMALIGDRTLT